MAISSNCWKYLVMCFNVLFAMSAVALFAASGLLLYQLFAYRHFIGMNAQYPAIVLLMMSIITCSVAWIGWRTARSMHHFHVIVASILIFLVVMIEFACFVWALVVWDSVEFDVTSNMNQYMTYTVQKNDQHSLESLRWDRLQAQMECCGIVGHSDYSKTGKIPMSCCGQGPLDNKMAVYTPDCNAIFQRGCGKPLLKYTQEKLLILAGTALLASVLQSSGIFCTYYLASAIKHRRRASVAKRISSSGPEDSLLRSPSAPASTLPKY